MQITKISNQNSLINFGAVTLQRSAQRNIQKQLNSAWQNFSLPNKPIKKVLNGPQGHPYTGRSIINDGPVENGFAEKVEKIQKILFEEGLFPEFKSPEVVEDAVDKIGTLIQDSGKALKDGFNEFLDIFT